MPVKSQKHERPEHWLTPKELAGILGLGTSTVYRLVKQRRIPHRIAPTGVIRFTRADLAAIEEQAHRPALAVVPRRRRLSS
ncbi:helix-turn-helix domain-containing protein [Modestobacter sp. VKM Ac-2983]|uniref:helix-turn-helix domain-containing protein n=1 Tax=Modestobacter sp. VKM Ac-2983 TaxID=3004137 RepID=UPI0022AB76F5|nr:helix-turn-helix domain-containing protein [Modestobacter sp. VKM Ac-2983]MCZ2804341.1 helix-turn-helix domain-containing protein [Modestobacter sp. VKM Ac-2983]